ncbi:MAG TPA: FAD-dependent oxidoreductase [Patescibacteria group bacterium]|nr:FAD-dependent oxidoreductase [Patescibacteria group bacterium]
MEQKQMKEYEGRCSQEQLPACAAACPLHVDARGIAAAVATGDFAGGRLVLEKMTPFPGILSRICEEPCRRSCRRGELGGAVETRALERSCMEYGEKKTSRSAFLPRKNQQVAVVGAGLSGLTAAYDLAKKGYKIVLWEAAPELGGRLRNLSSDQLPREVLEQDLAVLQDLGVDIRCGVRVGETSEASSLKVLCGEFDAVYLGGGTAGRNLMPELATNDTIPDPITLATAEPQVFAGGSLRPETAARGFIGSVADGRRAAVSIDRFLQQASLTASRDHEGSYNSSLFTNLDGIATLVPEAGAAGGYSRETAAREGERCLQCECLECVKACEYLAHYKAYPKRYVREVYNNLSIVMGIHHANGMINSCALCGLCREICPGDLDMGEVCRDARREMTEKGKMPPSSFDFALADMEFSNGDEFYLTRNAPGTTSSRLVFFPGCQLGASAPELVQRLYAELRSRTAAGLVLGCCGIPALWSGQQALFQATLEKIRASCAELETTRLVVGCPSCLQTFREHLTELTVEPVWTTLAALGYSGSVAAEREPLAVIDTCTTRLDRDLQDGVRQVAADLGYKLEELAASRERTECCGYGGLMYNTNRGLADRLAQRRNDESSRDYLTYCMMCRDRLARQGKRAVHLLDLLIGAAYETAAQRAMPGYSERRQNRRQLKRDLLENVWGEKKPAVPGLLLELPPAVREMMEERLILEEDVRRTLAWAEKNGGCLRDRVSGCSVAYLCSRQVTYWVWYTVDESKCYHIQKVYSHRIEIIKEGQGGSLSEGAEQYSTTDLVCECCQRELALEKVTLTYMGSNFPVELLKCPECDLVFIPEELALGKMLQVERALEDK